MAERDSCLLVVGSPSPLTQTIINQLAHHGKPHVLARTVQEALLALGDYHFGAVLASEILPDGRAYELMPAVEKSGTSLLVGVALSESRLWLPVVESGRRVLGSRALNARVLEYELERLMDSQVSPAIKMRISIQSDSGTSDARRKILARRAAALPLRLESYASLDSRRDTPDQLAISGTSSQTSEKESRREPGRFGRASRRPAVGDRRTA